MKFATTSGSVSLLALAAMVSPYALADDLGWYGGANIGRSAATIDDARITSGLASGGLGTRSIDDRDRSTGFKLYGGYQFNPNFALEGGYFDLGKFGYTANTLPAGTLDGTIKLKGLNLDAVGTLPITDRFSALGRVGLNYAQARDSFAGTGAVNVTNPSPSKSGTNYKLGVGLQYAFTEALGLRAEAERYRVNDAVGNKGHVDLFSVGLVYRFGGKAQQPAARALVAEPLPVAAAPASPPAAVPVPAPLPARVPSKVSFSADSLFEFDKSGVTPLGKQALDKFATDLKGSKYESVMVTGHTDRIGSHAYNQKLSERRAEAVRSYLADSAGIASTKITARGVDGANPVTQPGDCKGSKPTAKLKACLQPDRRVDVEVTGTR